MDLTFDDDMQDTRECEGKVVRVRFFLLMGVLKACSRDNQDSNQVIRQRIVWSDTFVKLDQSFKG